MATLSALFAPSLKVADGSRFQQEVADAPAIDIDQIIPPGRRLVIVAPHPDDEVLGCGGIIAAAAERNYPITLIAVTDGEACFPQSSRYTTRHLAETRRIETVEALRRLGAKSAEIIRLGLPDGEVGKYARTLALRLQKLLQPDDMVIATWRHDGHDDHNAVGDVTAEIAGIRGSTSMEVPIWAWHWPADEEAYARCATARRIELTTRWRIRKQYALDAFVSQLRPAAPLPRTPILQKKFLTGWLRSSEVIFL